MNEFIDGLAVFLLRTLQTLVLCAPTLLCGMLTAGLFRVVIGTDTVQRWFGQKSLASVARAGLLGLLMPVCSMGILPVLLTLRTLGAQRGPLVALALTGPLVTPWTIGYCLDRAGLLGGGLLIGSSLLIALVAGWFASRSPESDAPSPLNNFGSSTISNTARATGASLSRNVLILIGFGAFGSGLIAVFIPPNGIGDWLVERNLTHAAALSLIPLFTYVTPETAAMQAGEVVHASNMPGLLILLMTVGSVVQLGTLVLLFKSFRWKLALSVVAVVSAAALLCGLATDALLFDHAYSTEDSHAFEELGRLFHLLDHPRGPAAGFIDRFRRPVGLNHLAAAIGVIAIATMTRPRDQGHQSIPAQTPTHLSPLAVRRAVLIAILLTVAVTIYTYIPPPGPLANELLAASAEFDVALRRDDASRADQLARQLRRRLDQVSASMLFHARLQSREDREIIVESRQQLDALRENSKEAENRQDQLRYQRDVNRLARVLRS